MIHHLKIWPEPFELIRLGVKTSEVRHEGGMRRFNAGDVLILKEFDPRGAGYTGRAIKTHVTDLLRCYETPPEWQLRDGGMIVVMSLRLLEQGS